MSSYDHGSSIVPLLEMKHITKRFTGVLALDGVSFTLLPGEVHALVGENGSGKSTLIKILSGVYQPDEGEVYVRGIQRKWKGPQDAQNNGIATIHQEINLVPKMDVASNMFLNREPLKKNRISINFSEMYQRAGKALKEMDTNIDPRTMVSQLSVAEQQLVEIAKSLTQDMIVLVLDEPTASLPASDVEELFRIIDRLKKNNNVGIIYVSHRLEEIERLADRVTIIRDGQLIATRNMSEISIDEVIKLMVGRSVQEVEKTNFHATSEEVFRVQGLSATGLFKDVDLQLHRGEILGIAGLVGSGRSELVSALAGSSPAEEGKVFVHGTETKINSPATALAHGIGFLPAERRAEGLAILLTVRDNVIMASLKLLSSLGILNKPKICEVMSNFVNKLRIKISGFDQLAGQLSGGNQQKIVLAKVLARGSEILIFDEPTRGIDVGTRREIYELLDQLAASGNSIILSSSDLPELLGTCDRVVAMYRGRVVGEFEHGVSKEELLRATLGQGEKSKQNASPAVLAQKEKAPSRKEKKGNTGLLVEMLGIPLFILLMVVFFTVKGSGFASLDNLNNILLQLSVLWLLATSQTFALITHGIDLSMGSVMALAAMVVGLVNLAVNNLVVGLIAGLCAAALVGLFNGAISGGLNVEPFIVTLGTMYMARGAALVVNDGQPVTGFPDWFSLIDKGQIGPIPFLLILTIVICLIFHTILARTRFGRHLTSIGGNMEGARISGVKVGGNVCMGYVLSAVIGGVAGIVLASRLFSAQPTIGNGAYIEGMAAAVIGGVSFEGGRGNILGLIKGVLVIGLLSNGLNIMRVSAYTQFMVMGAVLVIAVVIDRVREMVAERRMKSQRNIVGS